jgi:hypothetical protein
LNTCINKELRNLFFHWDKSIKLLLIILINSPFTTHQSPFNTQSKMNLWAQAAQ